MGGSVGGRQVVAGLLAAMIFQILYLDRLSDRSILSESVIEMNTVIQGETVYPPARPQGGHP